MFIRPGFPQSWDSASVRTPYMEYSFKRSGDSLVYDITQNFTRPLRIVVRQNIGGGKYKEITGTAEKHQVIKTPIPAMLIEPAIDENVQHTVDPVAYGLAEPDTSGKFRKVNIDKFSTPRSTTFTRTNIFPRARHTPRLNCQRRVWASGAIPT